MQRLFVNRSVVFRLVGLLTIISVSMLGTVGSGGGSDITGGGVTLTSINISPSVVPKDLLPGLEQQFVAIGTYSNGAQEVLRSGISWVSSNTSAAVINSVGLATGVAAGLANITASIDNVTSNEVALTVSSPNLLSIQVSPPSMPNGLPVGASQQFIALGVFDNNQVYDITDSVTWASDNISVVSIDSAGRATGQGATTASANISASSDVVASNSVNVAVSVQSAIGLIVEPIEGVPLPVNRTQQFKALLLYNNNTTFDVTDDVTWTSNDPAVATVINNSSDGSKGLVTGVSVGRVTITANHASGNSGDGILDVITSSIQSVEVLPVSSATPPFDILPSPPGAIPAEHIQSFIAKGTFSDSIVRQLSAGNWFVSDGTIATFSDRRSIATVLGVSAGTVNLIYIDMQADGTLTGQSDTVPLTITSAVLDTIVINPVNPVIPDDSQLKFTATGNFDDASSRDITQDVWWETGSNLVAGFSAISGELTALSSGVNISTTAQAKKVNSQDILKTSPATTVNVEAVTLTGLTINPPASPITVWGTEPYTVEAAFSNGSTADYTEKVTWSVDITNPVVAVVSTAKGTKGQVTGVRAGLATLRVVDPQTGFSQFLAIDIQ